MILLASIDVDMGSEILCKLLFRSAAGKDHNLETHLICILDAEMTESAEALYRHSLAGHNLHLTHAVEDCDTSAEEWGRDGWVEVRGDADCCFGAEDAVLGDFVR